MLRQAQHDKGLALGMAVESPECNEDLQRTARPERSEGNAQHFDKLSVTIVVIFNL